MNKVLVDRGLLEVIEMTWRVPHPHAGCFNELGRRKIEEGLCKVRAILEAQPAEAEGEVEMGSDAWMALHLLDRLDVSADEEPRVQQVEEIVRRMGAALSAVIAERDMLRGTVEAAYEWLDKTEWVQKTAKAHELGKHRADVLKDRIDQLRAEAEALRKDAERYRWLREQEAKDGIAVLPVGRWNMPALLCTTPFDSPEMVDSAVDAAMAAKEA